METSIKPVLRDNININDIAFLLNNLGIEEKLPKSTLQLDYKRLKGPEIRIFNRIIRYVNDHLDFDDKEFAVKLIGEHNIEK